MLKTNDEKKYAIKIITRQNIANNMHMFLRELEIIKSLDHPNIIKFYEVYHDQLYFYIVMEYCEGGELYNRIINLRIFREKDVANIMEKLFGALAHMHNKDITHRDLKLENIIFEVVHYPNFNLKF
jgi:calcium-dependent protein kinase